MGFIAEVAGGILGRLSSALSSAAGSRVLETFLEFIQQPSCKVVLGTILLLGGGGLILWTQRKRRRKTSTQSPRNESPECRKANDSWIKSHFSRLSDEKLVSTKCVGVNNNASQCFGSGSGEANTTIRMETITTKQGEEGTAMHRESFTSKQKMCGPSVTKEILKESGKSSSTDEAIWAAVVACTKEIDTKGQRLANSMLQRATAYQHSGHLEAKDVTPEELKALEEVEIKLKVNFLAQREDTIAGANHPHTFRGHSHHGHQGRPGHKSQHGHLVYPSHQGHLGHPSHQGLPGHPSHQNHPVLSSHQGLLGHPSHQSHSVHTSQQNHSCHSSQQSHSGHLSQQNHSGHPSHQSHSVPSRSHQNCDS
ncbi:uncharacterized protein C10orf62 homolog [Ictidomys tridecemlineatus]|uniref:uncharacterized protein C10orf62 homolog n=1 Tax=Ictidomys tridecemlineatus TaxID=43179 RepID=UPI000B547D1F|nr:uncharacterized protein C10orf62 homolog [Ictidomys tridecemlineatus]KAG3264349.1 hypothetical protein H1C71_000633 [Ictidomys tridecemlineatus]